MSEVTPGSKTTPAARPRGVAPNTPLPQERVKHVYREGAFDYQRCPSRVGDRRVPYHVQDEQQ